MWRWSYRISPCKAWTHIAHCMKILCLMQRKVPVNVTISKTNDTVCTIHDHYCVFFSKITTAKLTFLKYDVPWGCISLWPLGLRRGSAAACMLLLRVRIPPGHGCLSLFNIMCCQVCRCFGMITRPEESYTLWCVWVWLWRAWPGRDC
jgi:hypothetical protein